MIPLIIAGIAALGIGGATLAYLYWDEITNWLTDLIPKLEYYWNTVKPYIPHAAMVVGDMILKGAKKLVRIMHKTYYKNENHDWVEETTTRTVPESEVPAAIRNKIRAQEADITKDMEQVLDLKIG